jgi:hypothetical protein
MTMVHIKRLFGAPLVAGLFCAAYAGNVYAWSTGIGIIDNNIPHVIKDPGVLLKDPIGAVTDLASKTGCYRCDVVINQALPEDKRQIANAVITTGFVTSPLGPIGSIITLGVLFSPGPNQEAQGKDIPVPTTNAPPTGNVYQVAVDCIVQRPGGRIEAYSVQSIAQIQSFKKGDTLNLSAPKVCSEYNVGDVHSVTSASMKMTGVAIDPSAVVGKEFQDYLIGTSV